MPRLHKALKEQIMTETRQGLLAAAAVEFAREGYVGANVNRISQTAGFAKGTIYNYFPSKRDLMLTLIDETAAAHTDSILQRVEPEEDAVRRLELLFHAGFSFVERNPAQAQVIIRAVYGPEAEFKERVYQAYDRLFTLIMQDILEAGIAQGDFRPVDPDLTTALLMTLYLGSCSQIGPDGKIWLDPGEVVAFILEGIGQRTRPPDAVR